MKSEILSKSSIYDWCFPISLEDISFYKNGHCLLYSVAHEEICEIYCSELEYQELKELGIEFWKANYENNDEYLYYEEY